MVSLWFAAMLPLHCADRIALVIGINDYPEDSTLKDLKNAVLDATLVGATLRQVGFEVIECFDPNWHEMDEALSTFESRIAKGGDAVVYFAGHGIEFEGKNYLMAGNARYKARSRLGTEAITAETFATSMVVAGAKSSLLLLDCCRENPSVEWATKGSLRAGLGEIKIEGDVVIAMAAAPGKAALEPDEAGKHGPYARALAKWIPTGHDHLNLFQNVRQEVHTITDGLQRTWENGSFLQPFYFAKNKVPQDDTAAKLAAMQAELEEAKRQAAAALAMSKTPTLPVSPAPGSFSTTRGFTNSLGMTFLPVPGTEVLFCEHETRVMDYAKYAKENPGIDMEWKDYEDEGHKQAPDHPVVNVSWEDARAFCAWLSAKEGKLYRLPTDHEWSIAVGIGGQEHGSASPEDKDRKISGYPWGSSFPPPNGAGNFDTISGYSDSHSFTAPAKSYNIGKHGLYDMSGNVREWCEDLYSKQDTDRVLRGGSWFDDFDDFLRSSCRFFGLPARRDFSSGFRCVVSAAR